MSQAVPGNPERDREASVAIQRFVHTFDDRMLRNLSLRWLKVLRRKLAHLLADVDMWIIVRLQQDTSRPGPRSAKSVDE
jgi:hypothetical protein